MTFSTSQRKMEIDTFEQRILPIFPLIVAFINTGYIAYTVFSNNSKNFVLCYGVALFSAVHVFYTLSLLLAPRFLYYGIVWFKACPWILSSLGLNLTFYFSSSHDDLKLVYCLVVFGIQVLQYIVCIIPTDSFLSVLFKPYSIKKVQNLLANIDLTDPNANLESAFGSPVKVHSPIPGQAPTIIRYGSQARNVFLRSPVDNTGDVKSQNYVPATASPLSSTASYAKTPDFVSPASPAYGNNELPAYDSISHQTEKNNYQDINKNTK